MRFASCGAELWLHAGVLGSVDLARDYSLDAVGQRSATIAIMKMFCTPRLKPPFVASTPVLDVQLVEHMRSISQLFDADAASDEQLCARLLSRDRDADGFGDGFLYALKIFNKDKAHGSRRTLRCTYKRGDGKQILSQTQKEVVPVQQSIFQCGHCAHVHMSGSTHPALSLSVTPSPIVSSKVLARMGQSSVASRGVREDEG